MAAVNPEMRAKIRQAHAEGLTCKEISERVGIMSDHVYSYLSRMGLTPNKKFAVDPIQICRLWAGGMNTLQVCRESHHDQGIVMEILHERVGDLLEKRYHCSTREKIAAMHAAGYTDEVIAQRVKYVPLHDVHRLTEVLGACTDVDPGDAEAAADEARRARLQQHYAELDMRAIQRGEEMHAKHHGRRFDLIVNAMLDGESDDRILTRFYHWGVCRDDIAMYRRCAAIAARRPRVWRELCRIGQE